MFVINCKNYEEISGDKIKKFIKIAEQVSKKYKIKIAISPPQHLIGLVANSSITVLAQHIDDSKIGIELFATNPIKCCGGDIAIFTLYFLETCSAIFTNFLILSPEISS